MNTTWLTMIAAYLSLYSCLMLPGETEIIKIFYYLLFSSKITIDSAKIYKPELKYNTEFVSFLYNRLL